MQKTNVNLGGVTRVPDDTMAQNGDLALALNLAADGDGLKMLEKPMPMFQLRQGETVLCVHQNDGYKHYITSYGGSLWWGTAPASLVTPPPVWSPTELGVSDASQATVMGNTVITQGSKMEYWLWDEDGYLALGDSMPELKIRFGLDSELTVYPGMTTGTPSVVADPITFSGRPYTDAVPLPWWRSTSNNSHSGAGQEVVDASYVPPKGTAIPSGANEDFDGWSFTLEHAVGKGNDSQAGIDTVVAQWTDNVMAALNKFVADRCNSANKFVFPFFIRYCYEMYDGSQRMVSDPVLLLPNTRAPLFLMDGKEGLRLLRLAENESYEKVDYQIKGRVYCAVSRLKYSLQAIAASDIAKWKDLVRAVGIYITAPIYTYDQAGKVYGWKEINSNELRSIYLTQSLLGGERKLQSIMDYAVTDQHFYTNGGTEGYYTRYGNENYPYRMMLVPERSTADIRKAALEAGQYYKLTEIDFAELTTSVADSELPINGQVLETLTNQRQLGTDYVGADTLAAGVQHVYNRRLHIANVTRHLAPPGDYWTKTPDTGKSATTKTTKMAAVVADTRKHVMVSEESSPLRSDEDYPLWLYYPNGKTTELVVQPPKATGYRSYPMQEHTTLNGSYWLSNILWTEDVWGLSDNDKAATLPSPTGGTITTEGEVWTSNAENPFVFQAGNVNQVGDGIIRALRAAVAPLAEDQHGYAPMYVFTSQGVWAMTHSKDGTPAAIDHVCGDIITEGTEPLSVGQSCLVMTGRGLLELTGRRVSNVSAKIDGEFALTDMAHYDGAQGLVGLAWPQLPDVVDNFKSPIRGQSCRMSFDYQHQRVYVWLRKGGWVLNLRTGLWTQTAQSCVQAINAYPDCEFVTDDGINTGSSMVRFYGVMGYYGGGRYDHGLATTRPIKLSEHLAKLREVVVRGFFDTDLQGADAQVWTVVHGSRNWHDYGLVGDNQGDRVTRLGGSAYRSHVVSVLLRDPTASVSRLVVTADEEQNNRLR